MHFFGGHAMMHERKEVKRDWFHRQYSGDGEMGIDLHEFARILWEGFFNRHEVRPEAENTPFA